MPSISAASMSSSLGYSCSARSYLREIGRSMFIATWWAWSTSGRMLLGGLEVDHQTSTTPSITTDGPQVAVPPLDRVLLDEAVAAEQLDAVEADLHALLGAEPAGQRDLAGEVLARGSRAAGGLPGQQPHGLQLDRDVGDHEGHRLAVGDRLAERLALVDVGGDVVEDGLAGADRQRAPREAREAYALAVGLAVGVAEQRVRPDAYVGRGAGARARPRAGPSTGRPRRSRPSVAGLDEEQGGRAVELRGDDEELGVGAADDGRLHAVEHEAVTVAQRGGREVERVEEHRRLGDRRAPRPGPSLAGEGRQVGLLLLLGAPEPERGGDGAGREGRDGEPHVAVGERLGDEGAGHRRALLHDAAERLGHAEDRAGRSPGRPRGRRPGRRRRRRPRRPPGRSTSAANSATTSTSICSSSVGVQVEDPAGLRRVRAAPRWSRRPARAKVRPAAVATRKPLRVVE